MKIVITLLVSIQLLAVSKLKQPLPPLLTYFEISALPKKDRSEYLNQIESLGYKIDSDFKTCVKQSPIESCKINYFFFSRETAQQCLAKGCKKETQIAEPYRKQLDSRRKRHPIKGKVK